MPCLLLKARRFGVILSPKRRVLNRSQDDDNVQNYDDYKIFRVCRCPFIQSFCVV
jgi:hypothetical protein